MSADDRELPGQLPLFDVAALEIPTVDVPQVPVRLPDGEVALTTVGHRIALTASDPKTLPVVALALRNFGVSAVADGDYLTIAARDLACLLALPGGLRFAADASDLVEVCHLLQDRAAGRSSEPVHVSLSASGELTVLCSGTPTRMSAAGVRVLMLNAVPVVCADQATWEVLAAGSQLPVRAATAQLENAHVVIDAALPHVIVNADIPALRQISPTRFICNPRFASLVADIPGVTWNGPLSESANTAFLSPFSSGHAEPASCLMVHQDAPGAAARLIAAISQRERPVTVVCSPSHLALWAATCASLSSSVNVSELVTVVSYADVADGHLPDRSEAHLATLNSSELVILDELSESAGTSLGRSALNALPQHPGQTRIGLTQRLDRRFEVALHALWALSPGDAESPGELRNQFVGDTHEGLLQSLELLRVPVPPGSERGVMHVERVPVEPDILDGVARLAKGGRTLVDLLTFALTGSERGTRKPATLKAEKIVHVAKQAVELQQRTLIVTHFDGTAKLLARWTNGKLVDLSTVTSERRRGRNRLLVGTLPPDGRIPAGFDSVVVADLPVPSVAHLPDGTHVTVIHGAGRDGTSLDDLIARMVAHRPDGNDAALPLSMREIVSLLGHLQRG